MRTPGINGIASIECPICGHELSDYDAPQTLNGLIRLTARCHVCKLRELFEVIQTRYETSVVPISHAAWSAQG